MVNPVNKYGGAFYQNGPLIAELVPWLSKN